jgi:hypothetical protein
MNNYYDKTLVAHGAYLFVENLEHLTTCDLAPYIVGLDLESKMLLSVKNLRYFSIL